jgi:DNA polymerase III subunit epsilon
VKALLFDTETNGLITNASIKLDKQPSVIEFYACLADLNTGEIENELETLVKPPKPLSDKPNFGDKKTITEITGITNEMLQDAPPFAEVAARIAKIIETAPLVISHNLSFDKEVLDFEFQRLERKLDWPQLICSVEATVFLKGYRLSMTALHEHLFGEPFPDAHRAKVDVQALLRCCTQLKHRGIL